MAGPIGVVLGSGLGAFADALEDRVETPYSRISGWPPSTAVGHAGKLMEGRVGERRVIVLAGRAHLYEGYTVQQVAFGVRELKRRGVEGVILTNAAGGINHEYKPGDLVLISDHINLLGVNPLSGPNDDSLGPRFPDMSAVYTPALRELARSASPLPLKEGVYAALAGPSYETPAEIRMLATIGVDMVGMSTVPEVIAASYLGMKVLGISCITNLAAGILDQPLDHAEVIKAGKEAAPRFAELLTRTIGRLGGATA